jgi:hypothetical protein
MEQCIKCERNFKVKDLFLQWTTYGDDYVCKDCIKKYKQYSLDPCYAPDSDITFVFALSRVQITKNTWIEVGQTLIGYYYGGVEGNEGYRQQMFEAWLKGDAKYLLRQSFNENQKDEEVLY